MRLASLAAVIAPFLGLFGATAFLWGRGFSWVDLGLLLGMSILTGLGITVGYHRHFTHRSFKAVRPVRIALAVLGIRPDRPGFSVAAVDAETPPEEGDWSRVQARAEGEDFANLLPGGELSDLHTLLNGAEVLKLLARFFQFVAAHPEAVEAEPGVAAAAGASTVSPARRFRVQSWPDGR